MAPFRVNAKAFSLLKRRFFIDLALT